VICMRGYCERCGFIYGNRRVPPPPLPRGTAATFEGKARGRRGEGALPCCSASCHLSGLACSRLASVFLLERLVISRDKSASLDRRLSGSIATLFHICFMAVVRP